MKIDYFEVENFRGISKVRLDLRSAPNARVFTLVGLNESGKTTVLEAMNHFSYKHEKLDPLDLPGYSIKDVHSLIPISKRANFNDAVILQVGLSVGDADWKSIRGILQKEVGVRLTRTIETFSIQQKINFKNSKHDEASSKNIWSIDLYGKNSEGRLGALKGDVWLKAIQALRPLMPSILYFPNFLFEFPDKITTVRLRFV